MPNPTDIRLAVASQPTVEQSLAAMSRAIVSRINQPGEIGSTDSAYALATDMEADPKAWSDAVLANTPQAIESAGMAFPAPIAVKGDAKASMTAQPTISQAVVVFLRQASGAMLDLAAGKAGPANALATDLSTDIGSWIEAVLHNTVADPPGITLAPVPAHVEAVLAMPGDDAPGDKPPPPDDKPKPASSKGQ